MGKKKCKNCRFVAMQYQFGCIGNAVSMSYGTCLNPKNENKVMVSIASVCQHWENDNINSIIAHLASTYPYTMHQIVDFIDDCIEFKNGIPLKEECEAIIKVAQELKASLRDAAIVFYNEPEVYRKDYSKVTKLVLTIEIDESAVDTLRLIESIRAGKCTKVSHILDPDAPVSVMNIPVVLETCPT